MQHDESPPGEFLAWDTEFFGKRIARLKGNRLTANQLDEALRWCRNARIDCLYFLATPEDQTITLAEGAGFHLVDVRILLQMSVANGVSLETHDPELRQYHETDIPKLRELAASSYQRTRFYNDRRFPEEKCDELYATWIEQACRGYADMVLVSPNDDDPTGFITCDLSGTHGKIGLVGVAPAAHGQGVGKRLLAGALDWFAVSSADTVSVVTQGTNISAQRLYQGAGFRTQSVDLWYHLWFDTS